jgi:hypothetical protein
VVGGGSGRVYNGRAGKKRVVAEEWWQWSREVPVCMFYFPRTRGCKAVCAAHLACVRVRVSSLLHGALMHVALITVAFSRGRDALGRSGGLSLCLGGSGSGGRAGKGGAEDEGYINSECLYFTLEQHSLF